MTVQWQYPSPLINLAGTGQVREADTRRQAATAAEIVQRLSAQPGVVLADEVGMGKTFVAFAVAAAVVHSTRQRHGPVLFLVPSHMIDKWEDDWAKFVEKCVDPGLAPQLRLKRVQQVSELLLEVEAAKTSDKAASIVLMKLSAFTRRLRDRWFKLAMVRACFQAVQLGPDVRRRFVKWAPELLEARTWLPGEAIDDLLRRQPANWKNYLASANYIEESQSVTPRLLELLPEMETVLKPLVEFLHNGLPGYTGAVSRETVTTARRAMNTAIHEAYQGFLRDAMWRSPLVILDEAHHLKNTNTQAHSVFADRQETEACLGFLDDTFDRMLFLTATPFQLGHYELINVLKLFASIRWNNDFDESADKRQYRQLLDQLLAALDNSQRLARRLDALWGTLTEPELIRDITVAGGSIPATLDEIAEGWWHLVSAGQITTDHGRAVRELVSEARQTNTLAEQLLQPWVIRHTKPSHFRSTIEAVPDLPRRMIYSGAAIAPELQPLHENGEPLTRQAGLAIASGQALPFLLSIRAQSELARLPGSTRAYFAEGLASSYETFHHTRQDNAVEQLDEENDLQQTGELASEEAEAEEQRIIAWYTSQIERFVPGAKLGDHKAAEHPKIAATVNRTIELWSRGEKVLIFVFYRQTAAALQRHISTALERRLLDTAGNKLGFSNDDQIRDTLARLAQRLTVKEGLLYNELSTLLLKEIDQAFTAQPISKKQRQDLVEILLRYVRSFSFIARFFPLDHPAFRPVLEHRRQVTPASLQALLTSFDVHLSAFGRSPMEHFHAFLDFMNECTRRKIIVDDEEAGTEFDSYLDALRRIQMGVRRITSAEDENYSAGEKGGRLLSNVHSITGETGAESRAITMRAFNSPLFPEILVASQILAEGVDLQRSCRAVIHHDLCWNPSTLEQRIGRVDRLGSLSEQASRSLHIFEPYLSATADEKMFRVVKDRERWFQVVMGDKFELSEAATEQRASRIPLPQSLARALTYHLAVVPPEEEKPVTAPNISVEE